MSRLGSHPAHIQSALPRHRYFADRTEIADTSVRYDVLPAWKRATLWTQIVDEVFGTDDERQRELERDRKVNRED
jgi:hypothetical protein